MKLAFMFFNFMFTKSKNIGSDLSMFWFNCCVRSVRMRTHAYAAYAMRTHAYAMRTHAYAAYTTVKPEHT